MQEPGLLNLDLVVDVTVGEFTGGRGPQGEELLISQLRGGDGVDAYAALSFLWDLTPRSGAAHWLLEGTVAAREETALVDVDAVDLERLTLSWRGDTLTVGAGVKLNESGIYGAFALRGPAVPFADAPEVKYNETFNPRNIAGLFLEKRFANDTTLLVDLGRFWVDQVSPLTLQPSETSGDGLGLKYTIERQWTYIVEGRWFEHEDDSLISGPFGNGETLEFGASLEGSPVRDLVVRAEVARHEEDVGAFVTEGTFLAIPAWAELTWRLRDDFALNFQAQYEYFHRAANRIRGDTKVTSRQLAVGVNWWPFGTVGQVLKAEVYWRNFDSPSGLRPLGDGRFAFPVVSGDDLYGAKLSLAWRFDLLAD